jgi:hypothetical protein
MDSQKSADKAAFNQSDMLFPEKATAFIKRQIKLEQFYINLKHLKTSRNSLNVPIPDLALPKAIPSLAVFA